MNVHDPNGNLPVIRAHYADILCQLAEELGVPRGALLGAAGIRRSLLGHPDNCLTVAQFTRLCEAALIRTGDDALGLAFGLRLKFTTHGSLAQAAISCDTLAEALSVLIRYFQTRFAYMTLVFFTDGDEAVLALCVRIESIRPSATPSSSTACSRARACARMRWPRCSGSAGPVFARCCSASPWIN